MEHRDDRLAQIKNLYILHPYLGSLIRDINDCREDSKLCNEPDCMLITGDTGVGKTSLIRYYEKKYPAYEKTDGTYAPVLYARLPPKATPAKVAAKLLRELHDPAAYRSTDEEELTAGLITLLRNMKVELIILDEFQHLIQKSSNNVLHETADWLKNVICESGVPIILFGMPWSSRILSCNRQLERRFSLERKIEHFYLSNKKNRELFRAFLKQVDAALPFEKRSGLDDEKMVLRLFSASNGNVGDLMNVIYRAAKLAIDKSRKNISRGCFYFSWRYYVTGEPNPFRLKVSRLQFLEVVEPRSWNWNAVKGVDPQMDQKIRRFNINDLFKK